ncbi:hypothetical protein GALMADRAFT_1341196 [Galerina marginata CBS 339.88]|uniref:Uncharacterized protein n=1 Tax=Galerina marginata (strain CBS 339.88) TaxID=685588 RepID=A0A067TN43_GALM3|nr:hypothetical protein GALMADRAFT_1341196 [Galerina marginata CBS 339.88]
MPIGLVEVANNTAHTVHYKNQESGWEFSVQPKTAQYENNGWVPTSPFHNDTIPYKSSNRSIIVTIDNGHQVAITDDYYKIRTIGNSRPEQWTGSFDNGDKFVLRIDDQNGINYSFIKYEDKLHTTDGGFIVFSVLQGAAKAVGAAFGY